jgi:AraC-like DNA-binding protein
MSSRLLERLQCGFQDVPFTQVALAGELGMSPATLRRYLRRFGASFRQIKQTARQGLAFRYLYDGRHTTVEIAELLGYSEPSAFYRAFKGWTALSPRQYRQRLLQTGHRVATDPDGIVTRATQQRQVDL